MREPISHSIGDPLTQAVIKYRFYPSIIATKKSYNSGLSFSFSQVERDEIMTKHRHTHKAYSGKF